MLKHLLKIGAATLREASAIYAKEGIWGEGLLIFGLIFMEDKLIMFDDTNNQIRFVFSSAACSG